MEKFRSNHALMYEPQKFDYRIYSYDVISYRVKLIRFHSLFLVLYNVQVCSRRYCISFLISRNELHWYTDSEMCHVHSNTFSWIFYDRGTKSKEEIKRSLWKQSNSKCIYYLRRDDQTIVDIENLINRRLTNLAYFSIFNFTRIEIINSIILTD